MDIKSIAGQFNTFLNGGKEKIERLLQKSGFIPHGGDLSVDGAERESGGEGERPLPEFPRAGQGDFPERPPLVNGLPPRLMKQWRVVPLAIDENEVRLAMARPHDLYLREVLKDIYQRPIKPLLASEEDILAAVYRWYEAEVDLGGEDDDDIESRIEEGLWDDPEQLRDLASEAPVIRLVNHVISQALEVKASDIHFEPFRDHLTIRFRIDGVLHDVETVSKKLQPAITSRIKLMAKMNIAEMRLPQDGRIRVREGSRDIDIRVSSLPTLFGESIVLRLLNREEVKLDLAALGLSEGLLGAFEGVITRPYGMILVTGPTGSGKTTTLYAVMNRINSPEKKIVTVEDPVEYQLDGINQIHVRANIGLTFSSALRTILRQDPDVILIGEIRDSETAEIAVQSALTGHMVFSTLHTNDAASAITRLQEMGIESYLLSSCILAVMAQRLVRKICPECRVPYALPPGFVDEIAHALGVDPSRCPTNVWRGTGCAHCAGTGYSGRTGIYEFLLVNDEIRRLIMHGDDSSAILAAAIKRGMRTLRQDGLQKVIDGQTTIEEVMRVTN
ncbi:MAG: type II secretion system ATPase GspE [Dissulfurimicrobium hydrothermale]|uniref:type II secretion system ATPase GspE n=1 Tax=Dissulfurimicrobium hydrothermale TaxID=1750598 RepID=UPI003C727003